MIDIRQLKRGTTILVETKKFVYEIKVIAPKRAGIEIQGGKRFVHSTKAILNGSFGTNSRGDEKELQKGAINQGEGMDISYKNGEKKNNSISTSVVLTARIQGISDDGKSWYYDMWEDTEEDISGAVQEARNR